MKGKTMALFVSLVLVVSMVSAQTTVSLSTPTVCCEETVDGLFCQNVPAEECKSGVRQAPTSCSSTSFCRPGWCFSSFEGTCMDNTPEKICSENGGTWSANFPNQCELGCCVLGDQAAFVSLPRCKRLSSMLGLETNYNKQIADETSCVLSVASQEKGACVYEIEFETTCKITTRTECEAGIDGNEGEFFAGRLCTAEELGTNCGPSEKVECVPGKDGAYLIDTCGNVANIFDSSKIASGPLANLNAETREYWNLMKDESESCNPSSANADSDSCGNCNYLLGSICRETRAGRSRCVDLNCRDEEGNERKHGESWCVNKDVDDSGTENSAGSKYFKHICINNEVVIEPCSDFRQEICIEEDVPLVEGGTFTQAACRANRWQDCVVQTDREDCENTDQRDCTWIPGVQLIANTTVGSCVPLNAPGLKFWEGEDAKTVCGIGNSVCVVELECEIDSVEGFFGSLIGDPDVEDLKCGVVRGQDCITSEMVAELNRLGIKNIGESIGWVTQRGSVCSALGDCGLKVNWVGERGTGGGIGTGVSG